MTAEIQVQPDPAKPSALRNTLNHPLVIFTTAAVTGAFIFRQNRCVCVRVTVRLHRVSDFVFFFNRFFR
jgi:hypothetical protein